MTNLLLKQGIPFCLSFIILPFLVAQDVQLTVEGTVKIKKDAGENKIFQSNAKGWGSWVKPPNQQRRIIDEYFK